MKNFLYFLGSFLVLNMAFAQQEISTAYATQATVPIANTLAEIPHIYTEN